MGMHRNGARTHGLSRKALETLACGRSLERKSLKQGVGRVGDVDDLGWCSRGAEIDSEQRLLLTKKGVGSRKGR